MSKRPTNDWKQPSNQKSPKEIRREQAKKFSRKAKPKHVETPMLRADEWNEKFEFASKKLPAGSSEIANQLHPMLQRLSGKTDIDANENNEYFTIDGQYNGDVNTLFQHVHFKKIPDTDSKVNKYLSNIVRDKGTHLTPQAYKTFSDNWHHSSYMGLKKSLPELRSNRKMDLSSYEILEQVMNRSSTWQIAKKNQPNSDQTLDRWLDLYEVMNKAQSTDTDIFDWAVQQIENGKKSIEWITNVVDYKLRLKLKE